MTEIDPQLASNLSRRFRLIRKLGGGGMGAFFLARFTTERTEATEKDTSTAFLLATCYLSLPSMILNFCCAIRMIRLPPGAFIT